MNKRATLSDLVIVFQKNLVTFFSKKKKKERRRRRRRRRRANYKLEPTIFKNLSRPLAKIFLI